MSAGDVISLEDELASPATEGGSSMDTTLQELVREKSGLPPSSSGDVVPLAQPEDFPEDSAPFTDDDLDQIIIPKDDQQDDVSLTDPGGGTTGVVVARASGGDGACADIQVMDVNGNGVTKCSKQWLEQKLLELEELEWAGIAADEEAEADASTFHDMRHYADLYFNTHMMNSGYSGALTKTVNIVRRRSLTEAIPVPDLIRYTKNSTIPTSHVQLHCPENTAIACSIFKDLMKVTRGELKEEQDMQCIRAIISYGLQRVELRDEIYCQLMRQSHINPHREQCLRIWTVWALCSVAFSPSHTLHKYIISYLARCCEDPEPRVSQYASFCLSHLNVPKIQPRSMPPSVAEIQALQSLQPLVFRIYFLDGKTKAISLEPDVVAASAITHIQEKLELVTRSGWALYESTPDHDRHILETEYLSDIISQWEERTQQPKEPRNSKSFFRKQKQHVSVGSPRRLPAKLPQQDYGKLVFCKRIYESPATIPSQPMDLHLLFWQAVHHNVQADEYSLPVAAAVHLAGLQAQVLHGDYEADKESRYEDADNFLCRRILSSVSSSWSAEIALSHKRASGRKEKDAKLRYLSLISQFPLYGCVKFFAHYKGLWAYGHDFLLAVNHTDIKFISIQQKTIAHTYHYAQMESLTIDFDKNLLQILLSPNSVAEQFSYLFECLRVGDMAKLLEAYAPNLITWNETDLTVRNKLKVHRRDWIRLYDEILTHRKLLVQNGVITRPQDHGLGLLKSALKKLSGRTCAPDRGDEEIDVRSPFWTFSRTPFRRSLMSFESHELEDVSVRMFNSTLVYTGLESVAILEATDLITVVQTLITKCMESEDLCNEFYLQLIKQTTDPPPELSSTAVVRYWHLMTMATCVMLPTDRLILSYLHLHLKRYALQEYREEGQFAVFCIKSLYRTCESKGRRYPPSYKEVFFSTKRQSLETLMLLPDGQTLMVDFDSASTADEVKQQVVARLGMHTQAKGFGIFEVYGSSDTYLLPDEKLADSLYKWEKWSHQYNASSKDLIYAFKKRIFVDPFVNKCDPIEVDMLYHQSVTDVFEEKIPLTKADAIQLCALRAQYEIGDHIFANQFDYNSVMRILPRHLRELISVADISSVHRHLAGKTALMANLAFLDVLKHWPLYGATFFSATQSYSDALPKSVWIAISQIGMSIMELRGQKVYATYTHLEVVDCRSTMKNFIVSVGKPNCGQKLLFNTPEGSQIVQLIKDYQEWLNIPFGSGAHMSVENKSCDMLVSEPSCSKATCNDNDNDDTYF